MDTLVCRHSSTYYSLMRISTSEHEHGENISTDMPSSCQAVQCTNFYTFQQMKYYHYWNTYKYEMNYSFDTCFKTRVSKGKTLYCNEMENLVTHHIYTNRKLLLSGLHKPMFTSYHHMEMSILLYISFLDF